MGGNDVLMLLSIMIFAVAIPVVTVFTALVKLVNARHEERMLMIEKGVTLQQKTKPAPNKYSSLRTGMLMIGLSLGAILGMVVDHQLPHNWENGFLVLFLTILGGGISFVLYFFLAKKMQVKDNE